MRWLWKEHGGKKEKIIYVDAQFRCHTLSLQSIYCRHALAYSYFILVFCLVFLTVAFLCVPMDEPAAIPFYRKKKTQMIFWPGMMQGGARAVVASPSDLPPSVIAEFSSTLTQKERGKLLKRFGAGKVKCLVCGLVAKDSADIFLFQKHLFFFANLVRWEGSTKISIQRCYKKYCSLRFNKVFFQVCTSNFWRNWNLPRFRCGGPWYRYPGGDGRGELLRSVASANVYPSCGAHGTRREGMRRMLCGGKVEECCFSWYNFHAQQIGYQLGEGPKVEVVQMEGLRFFVAKHLNFSPLFSIYRFHCAWLILWWHEY